MKVVVAGIALPEGNIFGDNSNDEFCIDIDGEPTGVFKRFEYMSAPLSFAGRREDYERLIEAGQTEGTSFADGLDKYPEAKATVDNVLAQMMSSASFSKQLMDLQLAQVYVDDNLLAAVPTEETTESRLAKAVMAWIHLGDFYCIEGLAGGDGENNPFKETRTLTAGSLDCLETKLPAFRRECKKDRWTEACLIISSVVERDYRQIDQATDVLEHVFGMREPEGTEEIIDDLQHVQLSSPGDVGKFYNAFIRFHNWMPLKLKQDGPEGSTYDSMCAPVKEVIESIDDPSITLQLSAIKDATSPKGLALIHLVDRGLLGDKKELHRNYRKLDDLKREALSSTGLDTLTLEDHAFYTGLSGGKWRGLKLLHDTQQALNLDYRVPDGFVITSAAIRRVLGSHGIAYDPLELDEDHGQDIARKIQQIDWESELSLDTPHEELVVRSSMYGEDGTSNFSGTYASIACVRERLNMAVAEVIGSYYSKEAIRSRRDVGLAHPPGISVIVQERIKGRGGVLHISEGCCQVSFAETPEKAVNGNGTNGHARDLPDALKGTGIEKHAYDFQQLNRIWGDIDLEFVIGDNLYLTQMRPKIKPQQHSKYEVNAPRVIFDSLEGLAPLDKQSIVHMRFLGRENIMEKQGEIMEYIRANRDKILAIEGSMPCVAHIPNKIEGHFKIPYKEVIR